MKNNFISRCKIVFLVLSIVLSICYNKYIVMAEMTSNLYIGDGYTVKFNLTSSWSGAYSANITIKNTGEKKIEDWCIKFPLKQSINHIWNGDIKEVDREYYIIKNVGWNQDIPIGGEVNFGFNAIGDFELFPEYYEMIGEIIKIPNKNYEVNYKVTSNWDTGLSGLITVINKMNTPIEDWRIEFDYENNIESIWGAEIKK